MPTRTERPLSPFMTYRWTLTMAMSIIHRITGIALSAGTVLVVWWLLAAASGPQAYATFQSCAGSFLGRLVLFGYTFALIHHLTGGARHLIWDLGYGFGPEAREWLTRAALAASISLTILVWVIAYLAGGLK